MKRFAAVLFFFAAFLYNGIAHADAAAAAVIEVETGRVLYALNETQRLPMASTTKIMTALLFSGFFTIRSFYIDNDNIDISNLQFHSRPQYRIMTMVLLREPCALLILMGSRAMKERT